MWLNYTCIVKYSQTWGLVFTDPLCVYRLRYGLCSSNTLSQDVFQFDGVSSKPADAFRQLVVCHLILIQHPAKYLLIHLYLLHTRHFLCYTYITRLLLYYYKITNHRRGKQLRNLVNKRQ